MRSSPSANGLAVTQGTHRLLGRSVWHAWRQLVGVRHAATEKSVDGLHLASENWQMEMLHLLAHPYRTILCMSNHSLIFLAHIPLSSMGFSPSLNLPLFEKHSVCPLMACLYQPIILMNYQIQKSSLLTQLTGDFLGAADNAGRPDPSPYPDFLVTLFF